MSRTPVVYFVPTCFMHFTGQAFQKRGKIQHIRWQSTNLSETQHKAQSIK
jgi:hypothetical protein